MLSLSQFGRLLHITRIFVRHDLDEFVSAIHLFRPYRTLLRLLPWRWAPRTLAPRGQRLREALEELGPIFVKFGQVLSTRPDLLPEDIAEELAKLQDQVPPFPDAEAVALVERVLGGKLTQFFSEFSHTPLASASVAQVHVARLHAGAEVVVKVLRPGIEPVIERDLQLLYVLARLAVRYAPDARRLRPVEVVDEFRKTLHDELDLRVESANASRLRANFADSKLLYVPKVYWDLTRREVMVMERIHGMPVSQVDALKAAGIDMKQLAHHGVEIFFTQAFRDGFFHADMHPGNIFVYPDGRYSTVTIAPWPRPICAPVGCRRERASRSSSPPSARCSNRRLPNHFLRFHSAGCCCICFRPHDASIWKFSRNSYCCRRRSLISKAWGASCIRSLTCGKPPNLFLKTGCASIWGRGRCLRRSSANCRSGGRWHRNSRGWCTRCCANSSTVSSRWNGNHESLSGYARRYVNINSV